MLAMIGMRNWNRSRTIDTWVIKMTIAVTRNKALRAFRHINRQVFENTLEVPKFEIDYLDTETGYCVDGTIGISEVFDSRQDFLNTLCHEMAHLCQEQVLDTEPDHGVTFRAISKHAKRFGYQL